jgi:hypothetical protein
MGLEGATATDIGRAAQPSMAHADTNYRVLRN